MNKSAIENEAARLNCELEELKEAVKTRKCRHGVPVGIFVETVREKIRLVVRFFCDECKCRYANFAVSEASLACA